VLVCAGESTLDVTIAGSEGNSIDHLLGLRTWPHGEDELRGRVTPHERKPGEDKLGSIVDMLLVSVGPGGAIGGAGRRRRGLGSGPHH
jgi:hypothetical protein